MTAIPSLSKGEYLPYSGQPEEKVGIVLPVLRTENRF